MTRPSRTLVLAGLLALAAVVGLLAVGFAGAGGDAGLRAGPDRGDSVLTGGALPSSGKEPPIWAAGDPRGDESPEVATGGADAPSSPSSSTTTTRLLPPPQFERLNWAGTSREGDIVLYDGIPPLGRVSGRLEATGPFGEDTAVRIYREAVDRRGDRWYLAYLPQKPNESKAWMRAEELNIFAREHRIVIDLSDHRLDLLRGDEVLESFPVAVGKSGTPTPTGEFFVTVRVRPPNPGGAYGPLALGLSAYSEVLTDWPGGGQAAIHGTNNPSAIGTDASHGCVRMRNTDILRVGDAAPVGTPVEIVP